MEPIDDPAPSVARRVLSAFNPHVGRGASDPWAGLVAQFVLVTVAALLYFGVRMITEGAEAAAFHNARRLLDFEQRVHLQIEHWAQEQILASDWVVTFFNWVYIWLHWPVILGALVCLYRFDVRSYVLFRNSLFVSGAIGLVFFAWFPLAPPRFLTGYTDTVGDFSTSYHYLQPPGIVNQYAAMPSLHVGWSLLVGIVLYRALPRRVCMLPLASPALMVLAVVLTANHYVADVIVGIGVALVGLRGGGMLTDWTERREAPSPSEDRPNCVGMGV